ncbi:hypothetical protein NADFUDRAFT_50629 [Nadsonia fulvescens var. elongata DSM 6958]|uniref:Dynein light intermediate chain n=1 Tax=Nadsonia fulvescens var. elongata DSM 6958 TaxID=857566 RepID=A0A1E3PN58_9ASCO|nr:hypothetical protein NADFUDRAFT_50629 [Nadsonia fulvescens var. elongata DSM 6958]
MSRNNEITSETAEQSDDSLWVSLLKTVRAHRLIETKTVVLLGGTPSDQKLYVENLRLYALATSSCSSVKPSDIYKPHTEFPDTFSHCYTYIDFEDSETGDTITRLNIYAFPNDPQSLYKPLLEKIIHNIIKRNKEYYEPGSKRDIVDDLLFSIIFSWKSDPHYWASFLASWIKLINDVMLAIDPILVQNSKTKLGQLIQWYNSGPVNKGLQFQKNGNCEGEFPFDEGQYDAPLGVNLLMAIVRSDMMGSFETDHRYSDERFDYIQQFIRLVLLKHGGSLIYLKSIPDTGDHTLGQYVAQQLHFDILLSQISDLHHNVIDRENVFVPLGWDSWGKIATLRDGFEAKEISSAWGVSTNMMTLDVTGLSSDEETTRHSVLNAIKIYESKVLKSDVSTDYHNHIRPKNDDNLEVHKIDYQEFLKEQYEILDELMREESVSWAADQDSSIISSDRFYLDQSSTMADTDAMQTIRDIAGPINASIGGIEVDSTEEVLRRILTRESMAPMLTPEKSSDSKENHSRLSPPSKSVDSAAWNSFLQSLKEKKKET